MLTDLFTSLGIYYDAPDDSGVQQTKSLEELTNERVTPNTPDTPDTPKEKDEDERQEEPKEKASEKKPDSEEQPDGEQADTPKGEAGEQPSEEGKKPKEATEKEDEEPGFFYDPEVHVEGEPAHTNKFQTREKAEFAAINKADLLKKKLEQMKEDNIDRGAVPLPKALQENIEMLDNLTSLEFVHQMEDDDLREFLNESDRSRQLLDRKHDRVKNEAELRQAKSEYEEKQIKLYDDLTALMSQDEIQKNLNKIGDPQKGKEYLNSVIDQKVKDETEQMRQDLQEWIDKVDSGEIDLSIKEFDQQKQTKLDAIKDKAESVRKTHQPVLETFDSLHDLHKKVGEKQALTPEQKAENMWRSFDEFQKDRAGDLPILADNADARMELVAAKKFAVANASDYNDLQHPADWVKAITDGWESHKKKIRANNQRNKIQDKKTEDEQPDDIPKPGDQTKLKGDGSKMVETTNKKNLDKLEQLTNARVGA